MSERDAVMVAQRELEQAIECQGGPMPVRHISDVERAAIDRLLCAAYEAAYQGGLAVGRLRIAPPARGTTEDDG